MPDPTIQVSSNLDRPEQRTQVEELIVAAQAMGQPVRVRLPLTILDYNHPNRDYRSIRDATWTLMLGSQGLQVESVERLIQVIHTCLRRVEQLGTDQVLAILSEPAGGPLPDPTLVLPVPGDEVEQSS